MPKILRKLRVRRVDLVDKGANFDPASGEGAHVLLFKSADGQPKKMQPTASEVHVDEMVECKKCGEKVAKGSEKCSKCGAPMDMQKKEDGMDEAKLKADLEAATIKVAEATARIEALEKEKADLQKRLDTPEEIEKRRLAELPESVRKRLETQEAKIAKMESDNAEREQIEFVKSAAPQLPGNFDETGKLLKRVKDVVKAEDFEALSTMLKAASAQIEKGELFREVGKGGHGPVETNPLARIEQLAAEKIAKTADLKKPDAIAQVLAEHPELYAAYSRSVTVGANADAN